mmetsp:Transcript_20125/g.43395  ORF Transcript_20125/g.43395 Transcript_20125/m.43395 type:complete len:1431 (+) Transcript_20125:446-4738(+)|eukprot:CAMPEP_0168732160 /NCGR_PEP_ID=MMETSP0724-20121128/7632_1 /TAXON_ID=265536 /ORGANISM="Amphiprora sp., Strain CCMP467" /LENGTH=1430 /DNA_ID=CAMNT_0008779179 /DNA_START=235 /DNA_END=4527 /DNA_ORIENTATION=+
MAEPVQELSQHAETDQTPQQQQQQQQSASSDPVQPNDAVIKPANQMGPDSGIPETLDGNETVNNSLEGRGVTNMAAHAPIRLTLVNRKSRKRKSRAAAGVLEAQADVGSESSEDESDQDEGKIQKKTPRQHSDDDNDDPMVDSATTGTTVPSPATNESVSIGPANAENKQTVVGTTSEGGNTVVPNPAAGATSDVASSDTAARQVNDESHPQQGHSESRGQQQHPVVQQHPHHHHQHVHRHPQMDQPEGWRVKLYRLNMDGSWDDCGTGRIICSYNGSSQHQEHQQARTQNPQESENSNPSDNQQNEPTRYGPAMHQSTDQWLYQETGEATLCVQAELSKGNRQPRVLLRTRILLRDAYQRQGDNIITWCEPFFGQRNGSNRDDNEMPAGSSNGDENNMLHQPGGGVDLALSFQDNAGCLDIWRQITQVQSRASELLRTLPSDESHSVQRMAAAIAAQHAAHLQQQQQGGVEGTPMDGSNLGGPGGPHHQQQVDVVGWGGGGHMDDVSPGQGDYGMLDAPVHLPDPPTLGNLEQIADTIAAIHNMQQREAMAIMIAKDECAYLRLLLALFPSAEERNDYGKLATLAACVKTILLLNEPSILELIVAVAEMFEQVCSCLEYDPDLREKANHRWFLTERVKFRTVVAMDNIELVAAIHRSFRVNYLRDTLLRPTMDESSLSTLSSLQTFSHADVVKGVTMSPNGEEVSLTESYLVRVIRMLGVELHAICVLEWLELEKSSSASSQGSTAGDDDAGGTNDHSTVVGQYSLGGVTWKQYLAPQDNSLASRKLRRRGCLSFLRELFNMVRLSLQQTDKDDFFSVICTLDVDLIDDYSDNASQTSQAAESGSVASAVKSDLSGQHPAIPQATSPVSLLSLLGNALADPNMDITEKGSVLEIIAGVAMHDPSFIRRHCIDHHSARERIDKESINNDVPKVIAGRPDPNEKKQVVDIIPPNDLLAALLFLLDATTDAGILLQVTEIMRIILDTDIVGDSNSITCGFKDEAEGVPPGPSNGLHHDQHTQPSQAGVTTNDQKQFFSLFYEHYMEWLVAPFQFTLLYPVRRIPEHVLKNYSESKTVQDILANWRTGVREDDRLLRSIPFDGTRSSFAVELLSFCVRAHLYWMKFFLLKSRVLGNVLSLLKPGRVGPMETTPDRCLKLAALRFLRSILSVHDEFYHRHIIQHDLFAPVFAALRENPVGDNLVSSSIVEMCDYIHNENIKSLVEYIVTKHLSPEDASKGLPRLEDVSSPYVSTLTTLREAYEKNQNANQPLEGMQGGLSVGQTSPGGSRYFPPSGSSPHHPVPRVLSGKALEDQRKFQEADEEESYFESTASGGDASMNGMANPPTSPTLGSLSMPMAVDEVDSVPSKSPNESPELHRTPRMFSLAQAPLLNQLDEPTSPTSPPQEKSPLSDQHDSPPSMDDPPEKSKDVKMD